MLGEVTIELLVTTVLGIGEPIDRLVAHADWVAFQVHPARDLFRGPTCLQTVFNGGLEIWMHDHLAMERAALLVFVLSHKRMIAVQFGQVGVRVSVPFDVSVDRGRIAAQSVRDL